MSRGASRAHLVLTALAVLLLVGVVAVASSGSTPTGSGGTRRPSDVIFDTITSLGIVFVIPAFLIVVYGLLQRKEIAAEIASGQYRRLGLGSVLVLLVVAALLSRMRLRGLNLPFGLGDENATTPGQRPGGTTPTGVPSTPVEHTPQFAWIPVLVITGLAVVAVGAYLLAERRRRPLAPDDAVAAETIAETLEVGLDDLRAEPDPRRAVVAAYARLERALAAAGLPRLGAETAEEYVPRILDRLEVGQRPVARLTELFERAKFSQHEISERMKEEAIAALAAIRDDLRDSAGRKAEEQRLAAVAEREVAQT